MNGPHGVDSRKGDLVSSVVRGHPVCFFKYYVAMLSGVAALFLVFVIFAILNQLVLATGMWRLFLPLAVVVVVAEVLYCAIRCLLLIRKFRKSRGRLCF